jgi:hypothetical protein
VTANVANALPAAQFAVSPRWPAPGDTVTFDGRYSHDSDGQVVRYRWVVSNGVTQTTGAVAKTVFRAAATYTVALTAVDDRGDSTTTTLSLPVGTSGVPVGAVDAAQSDLALSTGTVTGGASVTATVTARTAAGAVISGVPVALSTTGRRVSVSPATGTTNGIGVWTTSVASPLAQSVVVRAVADFTALVDTVPVTVTASPVSAASAVRLTQSTLVSLADSALVEVSVRDTAGNPVSGAFVTISGSPGGIVASNEGTTDVNGRRVVTVRSTACSTTHTLAVVAGGVSLSAQPTLVQAATGGTYGQCGAVLWLDASDAGTITTEAGSRVTQWRDKSGQLNHANAASGSVARPVYSAQIYNGRPAIVFAGGSNTTLTPEHLTLLSYPGATQSAMTYFVVYRRTVNNSCDRLFDFGSSANVYVFLTGGCGVNMRYAITTTGLGGQTSIAGGATPINTAFQHTIIHSASGVMRRNGAQVGTIGSLLSPSAVGQTTNNWLGRSQQTGDGYYTGEYAELVAFPRALTTPEVASVERALMVKWGIGTLAITAGTAQSAAAGTSPSVAPQLRITDEAGAGLPGATVVWQVTSGGGRLSGATTLTTTTDASGFASLPAGAWVLDHGTNGLTAWYNTTAGSGQSVVFTATGTLASGLTVRYDANNAATLFRASSCTGTLAAPGDSVGCWMNTVNGTKHVTQSTAAARPTVAATFGTSGRPSLRFVLTRENFLQTTATGIDSLANGPRTIIAAALGDKDEDTSVNHGGSIVIFPGYHSGLHFFGDGNLRSLVGAQYTSPSNNLWAEVDYDDRGDPMIGSQVVIVSGGSTFSQVRINGGSPVVVGASGTPTMYGNLMRIGQGNVAPTTNYRWRLDGRIAEILIFNRDLSPAERLQAERYLGWKWGVTVP